MQTIWQYPVEPQMTLTLPQQAEILTVQVQGGTPVLWVLVDPEAPRVARHFALYGTGDDLAAPLTHAAYRGTFQLGGGRVIFHLFEV